MKRITPLLLLAAGLLATVGRSSPEKLPQRVTQPTGDEIREIHATQDVFTFDDPAVIHSTLFPGGVALSKDPLETSAEFRARIDATGCSGRTARFIVQPSLCEVIPYTDNGVFVVCSRDMLSLYPGVAATGKPVRITVADIDLKSRKGTGQNAFGVAAEITFLSGSKLLLSITCSSIGKPLLWEDGPFVRFGIPVRTNDPGFRELIKAKKIGLALHVRLIDIDQIRAETSARDATINDPLGWNYRLGIVPAQLLDAAVVDITTGKSIVIWSPSPISTH